MKKILFILCTILLSDIALASGKIYLRANSFDRDSPDGSKGKYSLGLYVSQPILAKQLNIVSFLGGSLNGAWLRSDQSMQYTYNKLVYSAGIDTLRYERQSFQKASIYYATLGYKLWD